MSAAVAAEHYYQGLDTSVIPLSNANWGNIVLKGRTQEQVTIVHFFKSGDSQSYQFSESFKAQAEKTKGIFQFGGVDCGSQGGLCAKEGITNFPTIKIYPPMPLPPFVPEVSQF